MSTYQGLLAQWFPRLTSAKGLVDDQGNPIGGTFVYSGPIAGRPTAAAAGAGNSVRITDWPTSKGCVLRSDGVNYHPDGGHAVVANIPGPINVTGAGNILAGLPNGAPRIPGGLLIVGAAGSRLRIRAEIVKTGAAGALNGDFRFGTGSNFSDPQLANIGGLSANGASALADIQVTFPTSTTAEASRQFVFPIQTIPTVSGFNPNTGYYPAEPLTSNINTAADMFINVGYNGATAGDGLQVKNLVVELFQWG